MFLHRRFVPGLAIYSYMVGNETSGRCAVIDPTRDVEPYMRLAREQGLRITDILETHVHDDFISGAVELKARLPYEARIHCSGLGGAESTPPYADAVIGDGDEIVPGKPAPQGFAHARPHAGARQLGAVRPDPERRYAVGIVHRLPDFLELLPAHGAGSLCGKAIGSRESSTLGFERRFNQTLRTLAEAEWVVREARRVPRGEQRDRRHDRLDQRGPPRLQVVSPASERASSWPFGS